MTDTGETLTPMPSGLELIGLIEQDEQALEAAKARAETVFAEEDLVIGAAQARVRGAKDSLAFIENRIQSNYRELQRSVQEVGNVSPEYEAGIMCGRNLNEARQIETGLKDFNKLIATPNTPVLRVDRSRYTLGLTRGGPLVISTGQAPRDYNLAVPLAKRIAIHRSGGVFTQTQGSDVEIDDNPLGIGLGYALNPLTGTFDREQFDREFSRGGLDELLVGKEAIGQFLEYLSEHETSNDAVRSVTTSQLFALYVASRAGGLQEFDINVPADETIVEKWRDESKYFAVHSLLSSVENRKADILLNHSLLRASLEVFGITPEEATVIFQEAVVESQYPHETDLNKSRRHDLLKVYVKHDLGLTLPDGI